MAKIKNRKCMCFPSEMHIKNHSDELRHNGESERSVIITRSVSSEIFFLKSNIYIYMNAVSYTHLTLPTT